MFINRIIDKFIENRIIKANFWLSTKDIEYFKRFKNDKEFIGILDKIASSNIYTSILSGEQRTIWERNGWVKCIGFIKSLILKEEKRKINRLTNMKDGGKEDY